MAASSGQHESKRTAPMGDSEPSAKHYWHNGTIRHQLRAPAPVLRYAQYPLVML